MLRLFPRKPFGISEGVAKERLAALQSRTSLSHLAARPEIRRLEYALARMAAMQNPGNASQTVAYGDR